MMKVAGTTTLPVATGDGVFLATFSERGLCALSFPRAGVKPVKPVEVSPTVRRWHALTARALDRALAGEPVAEPAPLDLAGTGFQRAVWAAMRRIPSGRTQSYGEIARAIGRPKATRAVGSACGANPVPVLVPCHRVLASGGQIGGFGGGLAWKRKLLAREGVGFGPR